MKHYFVYTRKFCSSIQLTTEICVSWSKQILTSFDLVDHFFHADNIVSLLVSKSLPVFILSLFCENYGDRLSRKSSPLSITSFAWLKSETILTTNFNAIGTVFVRIAAVLTKTSGVTAYLCQPAYCSVYPRAQRRSRRSLELVVSHFSRLCFVQRFSCGRGSKHFTVLVVG